MSSSAASSAASRNPSRGSGSGRPWSARREIAALPAFPRAGHAASRPRRAGALARPPRGRGQRRRPRGSCASGSATLQRVGRRARAARPSARTRAPPPLTSSACRTGSSSSSTHQQRERRVGDQRLGRAPHADRAAHQHRPEQRVPGGDGAGEQRRQRPQPVLAEVDGGEVQRDRADQQPTPNTADDDAQRRAAAGRRRASARRTPRWRRTRNGIASGTTRVHERPHPRRRVVPLEAVVVDDRRQQQRASRAPTARSAASRTCASASPSPARGRSRACPARKPGADERGVHRRLDRPRVVGLGLRGQRSTGTARSRRPGRTAPRSRPA